MERGFFGRASWKHPEGSSVKYSLSWNADRGLHVRENHSQPAEVGLWTRCPVRSLDRRGDISSAISGEDPLAGAGSMSRVEEERRLQRRRDLARTGQVILDSGLIQEVVRGGFNVLNSMAQAGATSPLMAAGSLSLTAGAARRARIVGPGTQHVVDGMAVGYLGGAVAGDILDSIFGSVGSATPQAVNINFDAIDAGPSDRRPSEGSVSVGGGAGALPSFLGSAAGGTIGGAAGGAGTAAATTALLGAGAGAGGATFVRSAAVPAPIVLTPGARRKIGTIEGAEFFLGEGADRPRKGDLDVFLGLKTEGQKRRKR